MNSTVAVAVVIVGILFGIAVCIITYYLWKYIRLKKNVETEQKESKMALKDFSEEPMHHQFSIPTPYKSSSKPYMIFKQQVPTEKNILPTVTVTAEQDLRQRQMRSGSEPVIHMSDYLDAGDMKVSRPRAVTLSPRTKRKQKQLDIAQKMFKRLRTKDLHAHDDDDNNSVSDLSVSEGELSPSLFEEEFDQPTVGDVRKRKVAKRRRLDTETMKLTYRKDGKLEFTSEYNETDKTLTIHVLRIYDIALRKDIAEVNPFLRLYLEPGKKQKQESKHKKHSKDFHVDEQFVFKSIEREDFARYKLKLKVCNHGKIRATSDVLCEVEIGMMTLNPSAKEKFKIDLFSKRSESSLCTAQIGLIFEPSFSKLIVRVEQIKNLPKGSHTHHNPFVTATVFSDKGEERKQTLAVRNTRNPMFNQQLEFYVITDFTTPLTTFSLVISLVNHTLIGQDEVLGHVIFSSYSPQQSALDQWQLIENEPYKLTSQWHSLIGPGEV